jgi:hypothetical protein
MISGTRCAWSTDMATLQRVSNRRLLRSRELSRRATAPQASSRDVTGPAPQATSRDVTEPTPRVTSVASAPSAPPALVSLVLVLDLLDRSSLVFRAYPPR